MIRLIRIDGVEILLNTDAIQTVKDENGTVITLVNGEKLRVKNWVSDVAQKAKAYVRGINQEKKEIEKAEKEKEKEREKEEEKVERKR